MKNTVWGKLKRSFLAEVYPWQDCLVCGEHNLGNIRNINYIKTRGYICPACQSRLQQYQKCAKCSTFIPLPAGKNTGPPLLCSWCQQKELPYVANCISVAPYDGQLRQYILALKYQNKQSLARPMGDMIARAVEQTGWQLDAVAAIPLHPNRRQERGYNQSELLAFSVCDRLGLPYYDQVLVRNKATKIQNKLTHQQRQDNLKNAFSPGPKCDAVRGKNILLIDDLITSGATICNGAKALLEAGAKQVYAASMSAPIDKHYVSDS